MRASHGRRHEHRRSNLPVVAVTLACIGAFAVPLDGDRHSDRHKNPGAVAVDVWPGWRGLTAEGRAASTLPTRWSATEGIRWKVAIPGSGHSSPIVFGDRVYVTTAYVTSSGLLLQDAARLLTLGLVLVVAGLAARVVVHRCHPGKPLTAASLVVTSSLLAAVLLLGVIAYGSDSLFDFARCNIRGWIASTVFASLCLALIGCVSDRPRGRLVVALLAVLFAAFVLIALPSKDFAFRGGMSSLRMQIAIAAAAVPLGVGATALIGAVTRRRVRHTLLAAIVMALVAGSVFLLWHLVAFRDDSFPPTTYEPQVRWWHLALAAGSLAVGSLARVLASKSLALNLMFVFGCASCGILTVLGAGEFLATRSPYLAYQVGTPALEFRRGDTLFWFVGVVVLIASIRAASKAAYSASTAAAPHLAPRFVTATALLGVVFFVHVNYIHSQSRLVRAIVALDRESGDVQWKLQGLEAPQPAVDGRNCPATPTPVTDGRIVCAYFGTPGMMCALANGRLAWSRRDLGYEGFYGVGFSPLLVDGTLVIASEPPDGIARIHSLDALTGASRWTRTFATTARITGNNRTPIVREVDGRKVLILWGMHYVKALALDSGAEVWTYEHSSDGDLVSSAVSDAERLYLSSKGGTVALNYAGLAAAGDPLRWQSAVRANCASPVLANGLLFTVTDAGIAAALDAATGETRWRQRLPGEYYASLVASRDAVYFTNSDGLTTVVAAESAYRLIAQNDLDAPTLASMAAVGGQLFIRAGASLYAIGQQ
jgi:outer membrane protein assembly factor BamB